MKNQKKSSKKILYITSISILAFLLIVFLSIPKIMSSKFFIDPFKKKYEKKYNAKIEIDSISFSYLGPQKFSNFKYADKNLDLSVEKIKSNLSLFSFFKTFKKLDKIPFLSHTEIDNLNVTFHFPNLPKSNFYNVYAKITSDFNQVKSIDIFGKTSEDKYSGNFDIKVKIDQEKIQTNILAKDIPTIGLDQLLFYNKKNLAGSLIGLLGPSINVKASSTIENKTGPINIDLTSTNSKIVLNLNLEKDQITLQDSAIGTFHITGINPNLLKQITYAQTQSNNPIVVRVSKNDFSIPINPFKIEKIKVQNAFIDFGKILVSNTGVVATITSIGKATSQNMVSMWFTPINIKIQNGMLYTDRMDVLIDNKLHVCLWGDVNLVNERLNMNLGITSDTLLRVFKIKNLPSDYVVKIPIKGTIQKPKIDASSATTKILALSTLQVGKGIGSIIGGVITNLQKDDDIPPAKRPFPWEGQIKEESEKKTNELEDFFKLFQ
ncbi:MAG: hypothetical protein JXA94_04905 [Parachlamydiales bacterium]|nr:hypothetical protein [Parachlamydiales bacterium]